MHIWAKLFGDTGSLYGSRSMLIIEHAYSGAHTHSGPGLERTGLPSHGHLYMYVHGHVKASVTSQMTNFYM